MVTQINSLKRYIKISLNKNSLPERKNRGTPERKKSKMAASI